MSSIELNEDDTSLGKPFLHSDTNTKDNNNTLRVPEKKRLLSSTITLDRYNSKTARLIEEGYLKSDGEGRNQKILHRVRKQSINPINEKDETHRVSAVCFCENIDINKSRNIFKDNDYKTEIEGGV